MTSPRPGSISVGDRVSHLIPARRPSSLATDSASLILTSALTALTGIGFWAIAARSIEPEQLGLQTALLSLMALVGSVTASGTGNAFVAMLPATTPGARLQNIRQGLLVVGLLSSTAGAVAAWVSHLTINGGGSFTLIPVVVIGSVVMAFFSVKDAVMTGLSSAGRLPVQNLAVSLTKIAALLVLVHLTAMPAVAATLAPSVIAVVIVCGWVVPRIARRTDHRPRTEATAFGIRDITQFTVRDGSASVVSLGLLLGAPFLTTWLAGPVQGAVIGLMLPVSQGLDFVTIGVASALTKHLSDGGAARRTVLRVWTICLVLVAAGAVVLMFVASPLLIAAIGSDYDRDTLWTTLAVLSLGSLARVSYVIWAAVQRAERRTSLLLQVNVIAFVVVAPLLTVSIDANGAVGAAFGLAVGSTLLGAIGAIGIVRRGYAGANDDGRAAR